MVPDSLDTLIAAACKPDRAPESQAALENLVEAFGDLQLGKENGSSNSSKQFKASALQCFKGAQAILNKNSIEHELLLNYVSLGSSSLATVEALSAGNNKAQLLPLRYNFIKRLVVLKLYETAWDEASVLSGIIEDIRRPADKSSDTANIAIGAVLMMLLCWIEDGKLGDAKLELSLQVIPSLDSWLRCGLGYAQQTGYLTHAW